MLRIFYSLLMLLVCTTQGCINDDDPKGPSLSVGEPLPVFSVEMNDGRKVSNTSLLGKVSVIVFFNTGCRDCQQELPVIQKLWDEYRDNENVEIVLIAREESEQEILDYWSEHNLTLPFSPQENREVYNLFASSVIPRIYISDQKGIVKANFDDSDMPSLEVLSQEINKLL